MNERRKGIYLISLCCVTYAAAYMCRINLSGVVSKMAAVMGRDVSAISLLGSIQAVVYALGQLINGRLINRWKPGRIILFAALGSGLCNFCMGLVDGYVPALLIWAANAYIQSFFWGAIVRIITTYPVSHSNTSIMALSIAMSAAYVITWSVIAGCLDGSESWHEYFRIPGIVLLLTVPLWVSLEKLCPETGQLQQGVIQRNYREIFAYIKQERAFYYCVISVVLGALREGILFWTPLILTGLLTGSSVSSYLVVAIVPIVKMFGPVMLRSIVGRTARYARILAAGFGTAAVSALVLALLTDMSQLLTIALMVIMTLISCAISPIITSYLPLDYSSDNMSAPVSGLLDATVYLGASASTYLLGLIVTSDSLAGAGIYWMIVGALGAGASLLASVRVPRELKRTLQ